VPAQLSRDQKLALSYVEDAKRCLPSLHEEQDRFAVDKIARKLFKEELAEAKRLLQKAADNGEDVSALRICLAGIQAGVAEVAVAKWEPDKTPEGFKHWQQWTELCLEKNKDLVAFNPTPSSHLMYGWALFNARKDEEALTHLRIAEQGEDDEVSIQASKLIAKMEGLVSRSADISNSPDLFWKHGLGSLSPTARQEFLSLHPEQKIQRIKWVREQTGMSLVEAKNAVESFLMDPDSRDILVKAAKASGSGSGSCFAAIAGLAFLCLLVWYLFRS